MTDLPGTANPSVLFARAVITSFIALRFYIEFEGKRNQVFSANDMYISTQIEHLLKSKKELRAVIIPSEENLLKSPLGSWGGEVLLLTSWYSEFTGILLWLCSEVKDVPVFYEPFNFHIFDDCFGDYQGLKWVLPLMNKKKTLRDPSETTIYKKQLELIFQRCVYGRKIREGKLKMPTRSYNDLFRFSEFDLPVGDSNDLLVYGGKEYCDLSEDQEKHIFPVIASRIHALLWAENSSQAWDSISFNYLYSLPE
jgi:hypothetical protein